MKKILILLLSCASLAYGDCDVETVLQQIRPGAQWSIAGHDISTLVWNSTQTIPSNTELQTAKQACLDALTPAGILSGQRSGAVTQLLTDPSPQGKLFRAILLVELDEVNTIRALLVPVQTPRTIAQFRTAVQNKINSGAAD